MKNFSASAPARVWRAVRENRLLLVLVVLCAALGNSLALYAPTLVGRAIDKIRAAGRVDFSGLRADMLLLAGIYLLSALLVFACSLLSVRLSAHAVYRLRRGAFDTLSRLPLSTLDRRDRGDCVSRLTNDADAVSDGLHLLLTQLISGAVTAAAALVFMLRLSAAVTLAVCLVTPLTFLVARGVTRLSTSQFRRQQDLVGHLSGYAEEQIRSLRTLKAFAAEESAAAAFQSIDGELYTVGQKAQFYSSLSNPSTRFVHYISYILVGVAGGVLAIRGSLSVGTLAAFLTYSALWSKPFNEFSAIMTQLLAASAAARRIFALIDETPEPPDAPGPAPARNIRGQVEFRDVEFSYEPGKPLIKRFSLTVPPGSAVAVVGPTGAGKTTLVNLLMRFYEPDRGRILLDGADIRQMPRDALRRSFGMVLQESWLFEGSIRDNIAYGNPGASPEQIVAAAKNAGAHGFIRRLPEGYETAVREGGENLSQGQRQLLTIARAMLLDPPMLILDEATSSVDALTERRIQKAFRKAMEGRTSFVIAHRLATIRDADVILVMKDGAVIEQGSHDELLERGGFYKTLYSSRFLEPFS